MSSASPLSLPISRKIVLSFAISVLGLFAFVSSAAAAPTNTVDPSFTPASPYNTGASSTLTANNGTWSGSGSITYTYEWQVSPNNFGPGITTVGTGSTYSIPVSTPYCDDYIRVAVTATDSTGSTTVSSSASQINCPSTSSPSLNTNPGDYSGAELIGIRRIGETLTLAWGGATANWTFPSGGTDALAIQWQRNCGTSWANFDPGAGDDLTYVLTTSDIDCDIRVVLTATSTFSVDEDDYVYTTTATTNLRGVIQRQYGNTYYVRSATAATGDMGAAPDGHNDCLGDSSDVNAPNAATSTSNSGFEACAEPWQAASEEESDTNPNKETKIDIGPGTFDGAYIDNTDDPSDSERMLIQGAGRGQTTLDDCGENDAVLEIADTQAAEPRSVDVTVKDMKIDGDGDSCNGISYDDATGLVQSVNFVDLNDYGVVVTTSRPSISYCILPERVRVYQSSFLDGSWDTSAVNFTNDFTITDQYSTGCSQLKGIVDDSQVDGDGTSNAGVTSLGPVSPTVTNSEISNTGAGILNAFYTKEAEVSGNSIQCTFQGLGTFAQDHPDYVPPVLSDEGPTAVPGQRGDLIVQDNDFGCDESWSFASTVAVNLFGGDAQVIGNRIYDHGVGVAVGPVVEAYGPVLTSVEDVDSPVAANLRGNSIRNNFAGVISTNNGYAESTDLTLVGNRFAENAYGLTNYYDNNFDAYDQGAWPPAASLQTSPVEARNNWWGCNDGPTVNPSADTIGDLNSFDQFCGGDPALPLNGDIIIDGGLVDAGVGNADPEETNVTSNPYLVMGCAASPRTIQRADTGGNGGTSFITADLARNSDGIQRDVSFPPSEVTFGGATLGTSYHSATAETDQAIYRAEASLKAGGKIGVVTPTAALDYEVADCGQVGVRSGPDNPLFPTVTKADNARGNTARVPSSRRAALVKVTCPVKNLGNCEILSLNATSWAPGTANTQTEMILPNPILEPGESVELKGLIPRSVYRRLARKDNGSRARITIRVEGSAGITDATKIRDLRKA